MLQQFDNTFGVTYGGVTDGYVSRRFDYLEVNSDIV
jgi:hypothetical protein